jgi:hypothetical protein
MKKSFLLTTLFLATCAGPSSYQSPPATLSRTAYGAEVYWHKPAPFHVMVEFNTQQEFGGDIQASFGLLDGAVGFQLFEVEEEYKKTDIGIAALSVEEFAAYCGPDPRIIGCTSHYMDQSTGEVSGAFIFFRRTTDKKVLHKMIAHELGHALGLTHDVAVESLMYFSAMTIDQVLQPEDIEIFRKLYKPRDK